MSEQSIFHKIMNIAGQRCPDCAKSSMFKHPLYKFWKSHKMHSHCPNCGCDFEPETGFYYGAMYVSYGLNVVIFAATFTTVHFLTRSKEPLDYIIPIVSLMLLLFPWTFRQARAVMLHLFRPAPPKKHQV